MNSIDLLQKYLYVLDVIDKDYKENILCEETKRSIYSATGIEVFTSFLDDAIYKDIVSLLKLNYAKLFSHAMASVAKAKESELDTIKDNILFKSEKTKREFISFKDNPTVKDAVVIHNYAKLFSDKYILNTFTNIHDNNIKSTIEYLKNLRVVQRAIDDLLVDDIRKKEDSLILFKLINNLTHKQISNFRYEDIKKIFTDLEMDERILSMPLSDLVNRYMKKYNHDHDENIVPYMTSYPPRYAIFENTKLANERIKDFVGQGEITLNIGGNNMSTIAKIDILDNKNIFTTENLTPHDEAVYSGILSLAKENNVFYASQVYRAMTGDKSYKYIKPKTLQKVIDSIDKMARTRVYIDTSSTFDKLHGFETTVDEQMINVKGVQRKVKDKTIKAYQLLNEPIMYRYAKAIGKENPQLITLPIELLDLTGYSSATEKNIIIRNYLLKRIGQIKSKNNLQSNKIKYSTLIKSCHLDVKTTKQKSALRISIKKILDSLLDKGHITSYSEYKKERSFEGITINS